MMPDDLRSYPIGRFDLSGPRTATDVTAAIAELRALPWRLREAVDGLADAQLDTPYRRDGWTVRQVVHHLPDSHMNAYVRMRLALTVDRPAILPYDEGAWAELSDARAAPVAISLTLIDGLHARWAALLEEVSLTRLTESAYRHPDLGPVTLDRAVCMYAWHGRHHLAHITGLRERSGWS